MHKTEFFRLIAYSAYQFRRRFQLAGFFFGGQKFGG